MINPTELILTREEAMQRTKVTNIRSWARWCKQWGCRSQSKNRYSLRAVDKAIEREARLVNQPAPQDPRAQL